MVLLNLLFFYSIGSGARELALDDLNSDGKLDIVNANSGSDTISVLIGNGDGTFKIGGFFILSVLLLMGLL